MNNKTFEYVLMKESCELWRISYESQRAVDAALLTTVDDLEVNGREYITYDGELIDYIQSQGFENVELDQNTTKEYGFTVFSFW